MQAGTCSLLCVKCDIAVMWPIPPPSRSPSFDVSAIFPLREIDDIFAVVQKAINRKSRILSICFIYGYNLLCPMRFLFVVACVVVFLCYSAW